MKTAIVVAHHLPDLSFLEEWKAEFDTPDVEIFICEDNPVRVTTAPKDWKTKNITYYNWSDIDKDLGEKAWIIPRKTSAIKSYGFYKAWQKGSFSAIITVDNDCFPDQPKFVYQHNRNLSHKITLGWINTLPYTIDETYPRGFPYGIRNNAEVVLSHGLWSNIPDLDAPTALQFPQYRLRITEETKIVPKNNFYPMCGMNLAFKPEITPLMYFGIQGPDWPYDRFDDMWAGLFSKKICDHLGKAVVSGAPSVEHRKQSDVLQNLIKEAPGIILHEELWQEVDKIQLSATDMIGAYTELLTKLPDMNDYIVKLKEATILWLSLFK